MFSTWNSTLRELLAALPKRRRHVQEGPLSDEFVRLFIPWQGPDRPESQESRGLPRAAEGEIGERGVEGELGAT